MDWHAGLMVSLLLAVGFAGCFGDDAASVSEGLDEAEEAVATDATGSITGQVVTNDLEVLADITVGLSGVSGPVGTTKTDKKGTYTFNDLEPGRYRLQVDAVCCRAYANDVSVVAGEVTKANAQMTRLTEDDLKVPYMVDRVWDGFISCGVGAAGNALALCSFADDPNDDFLKSYKVERGLTQLSAAIEWDAVGGVSGDELRFFVENDCGGSSCFEYADMTGVSPLEMTATDDTISSEEQYFSAIEDERDLRIRIFTGGNGLTYQQGFSVYWYEFYYQNMPDGFQLIPDS